MTVAAETITLPARGYRISPRRAALASAFCWLLFAVMVWMVTSGHTRTVDQAGLLFWRDSDLRPEGPPWVLEMVRDVTALGGVLLCHLFALMAIVALLFMKLRREAVLLFLTMTIGWGVNTALKVIVGRPRPEIVPHLTEAGGMSFPSGHSFNSAVIYIGIALAFAAMSRRESVRHTIIATSIVISMAIAWSRVWLGVHFPSDVIAGWLSGAGWAFGASALLYVPARVAVDRAEEFTEEGKGFAHHHRDQAEPALRE